MNKIMPDFRVPESCGVCDSGESLISYTYDEQLNKCVRTCQTHVGAAQVFTGGIPPALVTITAGLASWFFNWVDRNYGPRRIDHNARRSLAITNSTHWQGYQKIQWGHENPNFPDVVSDDLNTLLFSTNGTLVQWFPKSVPEQHFTKKSISNEYLDWDSWYLVLDNSGEYIKRGDDKRAPTAIEFEYTRYNYNGHDGQNDDTFTMQESSKVLQDTANRWRDTKHKVICSCGIDTGGQGQAFKLTLSSSFGNGKFQKQDCGSCAHGVITPS